MTIILNGQTKELAETLTINELLAQQGYGQRKVAVAINETFVPRGDHAERHLSEGDDVEIVAPMPGG